MLRAWMGKLYVQVLVGIFLGLARVTRAKNRSYSTASCRRLHHADQDAARPDHLRHGRAWHGQKMGNIKEVGRIGALALIYSRWADPRAVCAACARSRAGIPPQRGRR